MNKPVWIAGIARGHNAGVCLLKDGEVIFAIEEERLTRQKYDGAPYAAIVKILEYTDKLDYLIVAHTQSLQSSAGKIDFSGDDPYTGLARKLGLIQRGHNSYAESHPQVIDLSHIHHKLHAACAFYRSGFDSAVALVVDGAGTFLDFRINNEVMTCWETESIFDCEYPETFKTFYKHVGVRGPMIGNKIIEFSSEMFDEPADATHILHISENAGITKAYEAVTEYCGFQFIEAGKTMGLFPYGKENSKCPKIFRDDTIYPIADRQVIIPDYPNGAHVNYNMFTELAKGDVTRDEQIDITEYQNRRDFAYSIQTQTQDEVVKLIKESVKLSGKKKVVISGGYGLNCVANYHYLEALKDEDIEIYVEPVSNDAGTAMGAALLWHRKLTGDTTVNPQVETLYEGPEYNYSVDQIHEVAKKYNADVKTATIDDAVTLLTDRKIVTLFQGRSENGPRALGNRTIMYDPSDPNGKDHVNEVKHREYFRPFAGTILEEDVHEWFDLRGMESSPTMMYAVNCQDGIAERIPAIIHVDGTCRIQTVNEKQNPHYYNIIKAFKEKTGISIVFNTSFNLAGEPLVETLDDAVRTLANSDIEYLFLPEYNKLITVSNY
jgi:carbamoyltransferase